MDFGIATLPLVFHFIGGAAVYEYVDCEKQQSYQHVINQYVYIDIYMLHKPQTQKKKGRHKNTRKQRNKIHGSILSKKQGWTTIHVYGDPFERGYAHGHLLRNYLKKIPRILKFVVKHEQGVKKYEDYKTVCRMQVKPIIQEHFPEIYEEMQGMVKGANMKEITIDTIIEWNCVLSMYDMFFNNNTDERCSAFIATGDATSDGKIVMAHNTHSDFISGNTQCIVQYMTPSTGVPFVMQCAPGFVASGSDWFICENGMMGCECTIGDMKEKPEFGYPYFCRIRTAMQYGNSIDDYVRIMMDNNAGDYACSWMFGDTRTNEISLLELGKTQYALNRTHSGVFYGMNSAIDYKIRALDTNDNDIHDLSTSSGARNSRLDFLLNKEYYGRLNRDTAKTILADHYDSYVNKVSPSYRTICNHIEVINEDEKWDYSYPYGCTDGKVVDAALAKDMMFEGRFGSSCGRVFSASKYIDRHPAFESWRDILPNFPRYNWVSLGPEWGDKKLNVM